MANVPQLASSFIAIRVRLEIKVQLAGGALLDFQDVGLYPSILDRVSDRLLIEVNVPNSSLVAFLSMTTEYGARIRSQDEMRLLCPLTEETKASPK